MKLVPIEPSDEMRRHGRMKLPDQESFNTSGHELKVYKAMTAECPTVEVVDVESFKKEFRKQFSVIEPMHNGENDDELKNAILTNMQINSNLNFLDYLTNSGYKLIKETK